MQMCGGPSNAQDSCRSSCGGLGCEGKGGCGGEGCDGAVTTANNVLVKVEESEREIASALEEVDQLSKMVTNLPSRFA